MMMRVFWVALIIFVAVLLLGVAKEGFTQGASGAPMHTQAVKPIVFDSLDISDAMYFKERKWEEVRGSPIYTPITKEIAVNIVKKQLGEEYDIVYWSENDGHYDIVIHAPYRMYGFYLVQRKGVAWDPKLVGYIFEDKIGGTPGVGDLDRVYDFESWPFNSK